MSSPWFKAFSGPFVLAGSWGHMTSMTRTLPLMSDTPFDNRGFKLEQTISKWIYQDPVRCYYCTLILSASPSLPWEQIHHLWQWSWAVLSHNSLPSPPAWALAMAFFCLFVCFFLPKGSISFYIKADYFFLAILPHIYPHYIFSSLCICLILKFRFIYFVTEREIAPVNIVYKSVGVAVTDYDMMQGPSVWRLCRHMG